MRRPLARSLALIFCLCLPFAADAKTPSTLFLNQPDALPATKGKPPQQNTSAPITLSADSMAADQDNSIVIAKGNVEVMQGDSILTADQVTYFQDKDVVLAEGNVSMLQPSGDVFFADKAELKDTMKQAVIHGFKARMADNAVLAAQSAVKVNSAVTNLKKATYSPCNICSNLPPFWQMEAHDATIDNLEERMTYHDAEMEIFGYPVFYTPYLSHPTATASAKSGFLTPSYTTSDYFGTIARVPYYWRIGEDKDVVITPWLSTTQGPLISADYRQLTDNGTYHIIASATDPHAQDDLGNTIPGNEFRGHIFAQGDEKIEDDTHVGFDIERASDDTYMRRYGYGDQQSLFSTAYYEQAQGRNFNLLEGLSIQGLLATDSGKTTPLVLPIFQSYYETAPDEYGIKYHVAGDAQMLTRDVGVDQRRLSISPGATLPYLTDGGQIFTTTVNFRTDLYNSNDVPLASGATSGDTTTTRFLPQAALEWQYPLINNFADGASWVVEPIILGVMQANGGNPIKISNEDSKLLELSDTNLFSIDRMPGLDLYDSGSRVAYGVRSQYYENNGLSFEGLLGQNYDFNSDTPFPNSTQQGQQFSDYIGAIGATYMPYSLTYRFALDNTNGDLNRNEVSLGFTKPWFSLSASYDSIKNNQYLANSDEGILSATLPLSDSWSIYGNGVRNFELNEMVTAGGGIIYKNECFNIMIDGLRTYTRDRDIQPTTAVTFRVGFKNLGEFGGK